MAKKRVSHHVVPQKSIPPKLPHPNFWIFLGVLLLISFLTIIGNIGNVTLTGQATVQSLSFLKAGTTLEMEIRTIPGMKAIIIQINQDIKNGKITFTQDNTIPFDGIALSKFIVSSTEAGKLGQTEFILKVKKEDILNAGLSESDIALYLNKVMMPTIQTNPPDLLENSAGYVYYSAALNTFTEGHCVIGKQKYGTVALVQQQPTATPLFEQLRNFFQQRVR